MKIGKNKNHLIGWVWWRRPIILVLRRLRQEDAEFESRPGLYTDTLPLKTNKIAQQVKVLISKTNNPSSNPRIHEVEGKNLLPCVVL